MIQKDMCVVNDNSTSEYLNIPMEIALFPLWGYWKTGKIPCDSDGKNMDHHAFDLTLEDAVKLFNPQIHKGFGFSFRESDPFVGIDYDHVLDESGDIADSVIADEVQALNSYTEMSQSGTGLHVICKVEEWPSDIPHGTHKKNGEMYRSGRFFAITGKVWKNHGEIRTVTPELIRQLYDRLNPVAQTPTRTPQTHEPVTISDFGIIIRLRNNPRTGRLFQGDTSGYTSPSEADLGLCNHIAFYTKDSGLYREKWDEKRGKQTYGDITIAEALRTAADQYDPLYGRRKGVEEGKRIFARIEGRRQQECQN